MNIYNIKAKDKKLKYLAFEKLSCLKLNYDIILVEHRDLKKSFKSKATNVKKYNYMVRYIYIY